MISGHFSMCNANNPLLEFNFGAELSVANWLIPMKSVTIEYHGTSSISSTEALPITVEAYDLGMWLMLKH